MKQNNKGASFRKSLWSSHLFYDCDPKLMSTSQVWRSSSIQDFIEAEDDLSSFRVSTRITADCLRPLKFLLFPCQALDLKACSFYFVLQLS